MCRVRNMNNNLTPHQEKMITLANEVNRLSQKLGICRSILREKGLGMLYLGAKAEHEEQVAIASNDPENYYAVQRVAWLILTSPLLGKNVSGIY